MLRRRISECVPSRNTLDARTEDLQELDILPLGHSAIHSEPWTQYVFSLVKDLLQRSLNVKQREFLLVDSILILSLGRT